MRRAASVVRTKIGEGKWWERRRCSAVGIWKGRKTPAVHHEEVDEGGAEHFGLDNPVTRPHYPLTRWQPVSCERGTGRACFCVPGGTPRQCVKLPQVRSHIDASPTTPGVFLMWVVRGELSDGVSAVCIIMDRCRSEMLELDMVVSVDKETCVGVTDGRPTLSRFGSLNGT
ncbi:hypothetical protein B296_00006141 [Ensete ventricosum]|uniref:Uncharacterized protein n=1 Tax=Ensete ventricosum TaxID=4639 RepID=A0A427BAE5_ENSVE|nr:hypothetical protein B296_00006141 [Ensete ventricosum]